MKIRDFDVLSRVLEDPSLFSFYSLFVKKPVVGAEVKTYPYPNDGGHLIAGKRYWVYVRVYYWCDENICDYDLSLNKIMLHAEKLPAHARDTLLSVVEQ